MLQLKQYLRTSLIVIGCDLDMGTLISIATSNQNTPQQALQALQQDNAAPLYLYRSVAYINRSDALEALRELKQKFTVDLHHGVWYTLSGPLREAIAILPKRPQISRRYPMGDLNNPAGPPTGLEITQMRKRKDITAQFSDIQAELDNETEEAF